MKKQLALLICLAFSSFNCLLAQDAEPAPQDSLPNFEQEVGLLPESLDANVDSLLHSWHVQYFSQKDDYCHDDHDNVYYPDSVYAERLSRLPSVIDLPYNQVVRDCIDLYAGRKRDLVRYMLGMADFYFPIIEEVLDKHGLPLELKYLAVVESALNPVALSRVGAAGLWQFMLPTGKIYGLEINSLIDDRRDPRRATEAACAYFKDMYAIYGDWHLVMAAYNCGPGNVNKAIRRAGGKHDFWDIFRFLPRETRTYVPLFIAANYIMNYYCEHNLCPLQTSLPLATDTVMVNNALHLQQVSEILQLDIATLRALNPQYKRDIVPGNVRPSVLKLPAAATYAFTGKEDTVFKHRMEEYLANVPTSSSNGKLASVGKGGNKERITHIVASGENLYTIANRYGVTAKEIRNWNGLRSNRVPKGKRLKLFVDNGGIAIASAKPKAAVSSTPSATATTAKAGSTAATKATADSQGNVNYTVKSGDSLFTIAKKYPGVSAQAIQQANGLASSSIHPGQVLKIPVG